MVDRRYLWVLAAPAALAALTSPAQADQTPPETAAVGEAAALQGVLVFTPADFAASRPNTALDLLNRLPGFSLDTGENVRGFAGAAGNVLVDGQRPTIKTESLSDYLARITIGQVERVELIRGGAPGIDMQGRPVVANIIRKSADSFTQVAQVSDLLYTSTGKNLPGWYYQATRRVGGRQIEVQFSRGLSYDDSVGGETSRVTEFFDGTPVLFERAGTEADGGVHTARANYKGPLFGGTLTLAGLLGQDDFKDEAQFWTASTDARYSSRSSNDRGEISVNYARDLTSSLSVEALALSKLAQGEGRNIGRDAGGDQLFTVDAEAGESIARGVLRYTYSPRLSFEGGGEGAFNYREQSIGLTVNGAPIALPASDVRVEEWRGEGFVQGTWRPSPKWSFESGVRVETSTISQSGDTTLERSFVYPKPRFQATWSPTDKDQVRFRVEREVGQLDFRQFVSNVSLNSGVLTAGNADLEPDKSIIYEAVFEKRFWNAGALVLTLRHEDITDVADQKPFTVLVDDNADGVPDDADSNGIPDTRLVAGPGNIGHGTNNVLLFNLTLPLDRFGIKGGELKFDTQWQDSEVVDPLTLQARRFSGQRPDNLNVDFRQDLPEMKLSYGFGWFDGWSERTFRLGEVDHLRLEKYINSFVEYKPTPRFTLRGEINNFMPYTFQISRAVYDGPRNTGNLEFIETERRSSQILAFVRARYQFG
jgi:TonB-dependent Receptor Plug Domain